MRSGITRRWLRGNLLIVNSSHFRLCRSIVLIKLRFFSIAFWVCVFE